MRLPPAPRGRAALAVVVVVGIGIASSACGGSTPEADDAGAPVRSSRPAGATATTGSNPLAGSVPTPGTTPPASATVPGFTASVTPVTATDLGASWRDGCPVAPDQLRRVALTFWDFDGRVQSGALVVHAEVVDAVTAIFHRLFDSRVPIRRMETIDRYAGSDDASMAADNTSAFNCRRAVTSGAAQWSAHAFGRAVDINPVENPYVFGGTVLPPEGAPYVDRATPRPGMATPGSPLVEAFSASGWRWGGRWTGSPDYQHFSADGS